MEYLAYKELAADILINLVTDKNSKNFSYENQELLINGKHALRFSEQLPDHMLNDRVKYCLEKTGLIGADLILLGTAWVTALKKGSLSPQELRTIGLENLLIPTTSDDPLGQWRRMVEARLMECIPDLDYVERFSPNINLRQQNEQPLELAPLLDSWAKQLLTHPKWACAEPPLPDIPPLPLDDVWVDLYATEPFGKHQVEDALFSQAIEQHYQESQWINISIDFLMESLKGTMVLVGAPGIGKTTLMKWLARRLILKPEGRFLLPLFISLRAYALAKPHNPQQDLLSFALNSYGITSSEQIEKWSTTISYLSGTQRDTVLLLLDGWDEVPIEMREVLIAEIQKLSHAFSIIITSRPSAYPRALPADQLYEISDLSLENVIALIHRWHDIMQQPQQATILLTHLRENPDLLKLARNPFLLNLLCAINMEPQSGVRILPRNRTELYTQTLDHIYKYQSDKYPAAPFITQHKNNTQKLALWLLAEAPNHPHYLFGAEEVEQVTGDSQLLSTVLSPSRLLSQWQMDNESFHFLHTTFQEYLAAAALLKKDKEKRSELINRERYNPAWQEILRFIAGQNINSEHDFWDIIRQLAQDPDQCGLIDIRLTELIAETNTLDGGRTLLNYDLRDRLWRYIKEGIGTDHFVEAYALLDSDDYIERVRNLHKQESTEFKARLIRSFRKIPTQHSSVALLNRLIRGDRNDAAVASYAVKDILDEQGVETLRLAIQDQTLLLERREILIRALGNSKDYTSIPFLMKLYQDNAYNTIPKLKKVILLALGGIGGQQAAHALEIFLHTAPDLLTQKMVIDALSRARDLPARDILMTALVKVMPDDPLLGDILTALCEIPISRHSSLISVYLDRDNFSEDIREQAIEALAEATERHITEKLAEIGKSDPSETLRIAALTALQKRVDSFNFNWLVERFTNKTYSEEERSKALRAILEFYKRAQQGHTSTQIPFPLLHKQILNLTKLSFSEISTDINTAAAMDAHILGEDIAKTLLNVCEKAETYSDSTREFACISLGKLKYKPALSIFNTWIEKAQNLTDDEEKPLNNIEERFARAAAEACVHIDLISATEHPAKTMKAAVSKFSLTHGYLIYPDKIIYPTGKTRYKNEEKKKIIKEIPPLLKLDPHSNAIKQIDKIRDLDHYLLKTEQACRSSKHATKGPPPLFNKSGTNNDHLTYGIDINTGKKFLKGTALSAQSAQKLMNRLQEIAPHCMSTKQ